MNPKRARFVAEYLKDLNATQAAIRAGYSPKTAKVQGYRLLTDAAVAAAVEAGQAARAARTEVTIDRVVLELARIAFADRRTILKPDGTVRPPVEWPSDVAAAVAGYECDGPRLKVKLSDKVAALNLLGKHLGAFAERLTVRHENAAAPLAALTDDQLRQLVAALPPAAGA